MEKRKLRLDDLEVESFETAVEPAQRGTVKAHDHSEACYTDEFYTCPESCGAGTCNEWTCGTCAISCFGTCQSCPASCWTTCVDQYTCGEQFSCDAPACTYAHAHC